MHDHAPSSQPEQNGTKIPRRRKDGRGARGGTGGTYAEPLREARHRPGGHQNSSLRAFAGKAFTTVLAFFASCVAMLARVLKAVLMTPFFTSQLSASAAVRALLVMTVDFIIGAISAAWVGKQRRSRYPVGLCTWARTSH